MSRDFRTLHRLAPLRMIIPLQSTMTVQLPATNDSQNFVSHRPFPSHIPTIARKLIRKMHLKNRVWGRNRDYEFASKTKKDHTYWK